MDIIASDKKNPPSPMQQLVHVWPMYRAFVGVGVICGFLIVMAFILTQPMIKKNQDLYLEAAILQVLQGATYKKAFVLVESPGAVANVVPAKDDDKLNLVYAAYNQQNELVGVAVEAEGMGYQDTIHLLYGYDLRQQAIVGMKVLASKETPGLGDKIEKDSSFISNFVALDVSLTSDGSALKNNIQLVKHGFKTQAWHVDGITGATISSRAIANILNSSAGIKIPVLYRHFEMFTAGAVKSD